MSKGLFPRALKKMKSINKITGNIQALYEEISDSLLKYIKEHWNKQQFQNRRLGITKIPVPLKLTYIFNPILNRF